MPEAPGFAHQLPSGVQTIKTGTTIRPYRLSGFRVKTPLALSYVAVSFPPCSAMVSTSVMSPFSASTLMVQDFFGSHMQR
jgi:hypothetical protein